MYVNRYISALACALTFGFATGSHADDVKSGPAKASSGRLPMTQAYPEGFTPAPHIAGLLSPRDIFHTVTPVRLKPMKYVPEGATGPHPMAISGTAFYQNVGGGFYDASAHDALDDIYLPVGIAGSTGVTLTGFTASGRNNDTVVHDLYGMITFYDSIDLTSLSNVAVKPLASYQYTVTAVPAATSFRVGPFVLASSNVVGPTLTHDLGTTGGGVYGVSIGYYTDTTYKTLSTTATCRFAYSFLPQIGYSGSLFWPDINNDGTFPITQPNTGYWYGGPPYNANLQMELDGTSANDLTFDASGTLTFQGLPHGSPAQAVKITLTSTTSPTNKPLVFNITLNLADVKTGTVVTGQAGTYTLIGIPADTYNIDIKPANNPAADLLAQNITTVNLYGVDATFVATTTTATGNIALEGVPDLSATSFNALPGTFTIGFYTPGSVTPGTPATPVYSATVSLKTTPGSANGSYSVSGIPFGTYDVIIKGAKNLAVKLPSVALTTPNATLADALLPAGDANNDDIVDTTDFGVLVGVYGSDSNVTGSGYDASADFNFDGIVDTSDFGLLVGEYGNQGPL